MRPNLASMVGSWRRPGRVRRGEAERGQRPGATCRPSPWRVRRATRDEIGDIGSREYAERWVSIERFGKVEGALRHRPRVGNPGAGPKIAQALVEVERNRDGIREVTEDKEGEKKGKTEDVYDG